MPGPLYGKFPCVEGDKQLAQRSPESDPHTTAAQLRTSETLEKETHCSDRDTLHGRTSLAGGVHPKRKLQKKPQVLAGQI